MMRAATTISRAMVGLAGIGIVVMLVLVVSDVISRAVFNVALPGIDTIVASYLMVATIFLPLALIQILDENIAVDALRNAVPDMLKDVFDLIGHVLGVIFYALLGWIYFKVAVDAFEIREFVTGTWDVPIWPARIFMPLGLFLATVAAGLKALAAIRALISGAKPPSHDATGAF